ncbi:LPS assembly lipoprotein LptE [Parvularcula sp. IMCC14364]|uniref:LPS assembly lipoprotein LptE n=1 Tax=Parvularcula sp. IMCC14364 TaxID=3067902 RepID=UPI0027405085|nr:LPS assembly lipoprotein LptE [Parvularcula sp. IMCC14364]
MIRKHLKMICTSAALVISAPFLSACGFTPLYADNDQELTRSLAEVNILPIREPETASYVLENELRDFSSRTAATRYDLQVGLRENRKSVSVTGNAQTARFEYTLLGTYTLTDNETGQRYRNSKSVITSYGIVPSQYASLVAQEDASRKAAIELAQQIEFDLVFYFKGQIEGTQVEAGQEFEEQTQQETLQERQIQEILGEDFERN